MSHNDLHYMTIPFSEVSEEMVGAAVESSFDTLRHSVLGTDRVVLKYEGSTPPVFDGIETYTHSEILTIMSGPGWTTPSDPSTP